MSESKQRFANGTKLYITKCALTTGITEHVFRRGLDSADTEGQQQDYVYIKGEWGRNQYRNQYVVDRDIFADKREALKYVLAQVDRKRESIRKQQKKLDLIATRCKAELDANP